MKYVKMLGLLAVAAAALMAFAGTASATITSPVGTKYAGNIKATSTNSELDGAVDVKCANSTVEFDPSGTGATSGIVTALSFTNCGSDTVSVIHKGEMNINSYGWVSLNGAEITVQLHRSVFGIPITTHCIYFPSGAPFGHIWDGTSTINASMPLFQRITDDACGNGAELTGTYNITNPGAITVD